jgi:hypothetical protein
MDTETGRWVSAGECGPEANEFEVKGLTKGKRYKLRVKAYNKEGESEPAEMSDTFVAQNPYGKIPSKAFNLFFSLNVCHTLCGVRKIFSHLSPHTRLTNNREKKKTLCTFKTFIFHLFPPPPRHTNPTSESYQTNPMHLASPILLTTTISR